jgi:hypothetical protein
MLFLRSVGTGTHLVALRDAEADSLNDYVVSLEPSQILTGLDTGDREFEGNSWPGPTGFTRHDLAH